MADKVRTHWLDVNVYDGSFHTRVLCPDEHLGDKRPCAVWANDDGSTRENECTFQQYAENGGLEDWLVGTWQFPLAPLTEGGSGDDWHAQFEKKEGA